MVGTIGLVLFGLTILPIAAMAKCVQPVPVVAAVRLQRVTHTSHLNLYHISATVANRGDQPQAGDVLQFIDVVQYGSRLDDRGVPPLKPGQSYTINYVWPRSSDAGRWTSPLDFRLRFATAANDCNPRRSSAGITV